MGYNIDEIRELAEMVSKFGLGKIALKTKDEEIVIEAKKNVVQPSQAQPLPVSMNNAVPAVAEKPAEESPKGNVVKSPIVGTFYSAPAPEKPPFVKVGSKVNKGDIIMIIESMKLMNEVQSEFDGTVSKILVKNGEAVEYDQPIMIIE